MGSYASDLIGHTLQGLFNARAFHERLRQEPGRAPRYHDPLSVLISRQRPTRPRLRPLYTARRSRECPADTPRYIRGPARLLADIGEGVGRGDREPGEPYALPPAQTADSIHPVVPVARTDERQAVDTARESALERSLAVFEEGARSIGKFEDGVTIVVLPGERTPLQERHGLIQYSASPVADTY